MMMSVLRSNFWRLALQPVLLVAALLLPTLHLHPVYIHDHDEQSHQHAIVHADFLSALANDHSHSDHGEITFGDGSPSAFLQSSLTALLVRGLDVSPSVLEKTPVFLAFDPALLRSWPAIFAQGLKREHAPPEQQAFITPNSPRSPPTVA
jgi:hypothetical protein